MRFSSRLVVLCLASAGALIACSSSSSGSSTSQNGTSPTSACAQAKSVADTCNAQPAEGGVQLTVDFDETKCEQAGAQGTTIADCITANKDNCSCVLTCSVKGSCP
jgi:hypothetical protein